MKSIKYIPLVLVLFIQSYVASFSQNSMPDTVAFEQTTIKEEVPPYFVLGGGYAGTFFFMNMNDLNSHLKTRNFPINDIKSTIYVSGAEGFVPFPFIRNFRIGFFGLSGTNSQQSNDSSAFNGINTTIKFTSFSFAYGLVLTKGLVVLPTVNLGWATETIDSYRTPSSFDFTGDLVPSSKPQYYSHSLVGSYYLLQPAVNIEYAITNFLMARVNAQYSLAFSGDWKYNNNGTVSNIPAGIKPQGFGVQFGIFAGLFNY